MGRRHLSLNLLGDPVYSQRISGCSGTYNPHAKLPFVSMRRGPRRVVCCPMVLATALGSITSEFGTHFYGSLFTFGRWDPPRGRMWPRQEQHNVGHNIMFVKRVRYIGSLGETPFVCSGTQFRAPASPKSLDSSRRETYHMVSVVLDPHAQSLKRCAHVLITKPKSKVKSRTTKVHSDSGLMRLGGP